ncbi:MAG: hypothetical protein QOJ58_4444 [Alphaproteobacteria bacterium]|jgi:hypothetical protein|nr:hypothetical protein [Alphaproteobacteria bacterium]MEA2963163.1 hypothetical protein [Alphaproteobacteria bacterium]
MALKLRSSGLGSGIDKDRPDYSTPGPPESPHSALGAPLR